MEFEINGAKWIIEEVDDAVMNNEMKNDYTLGATIYKEQKILLVKSNANILRTLIHELTHVWLWECGHNQHREDKIFTSEDICEIVASSNNFINEIVEKYKKQQSEAKNS